MKYVSHYECIRCEKTFPKTYQAYTCDACEENGILDIIYDYEAMKQDITLDYFKTNKTYSLWRYAPLMSVVATKDFKKTLQVGWTPLYKADALSHYLNIQALYIKDDGLNPTGSLKDRASVVACMKAKENGFDTIACASTGNAASSLAGNAARIGLKTVIFVPNRVPKGKLAQLYSYGATVIKVQGDYRETYNLSSTAINTFGWYNRNAAINPHLVEGKKTVAFEIAEQLDFNPTDWVVSSVGDGCTIGALYKGFYDLKQLGLIAKIPKLLGIQSEGCAPIYRAFKSGSPLQAVEENTLADSIAVGIPRNPLKALKAVEMSGGTFLTVSDQAILQWGKTLGTMEGIFAEPASAAGVAGLAKALQKEIIKPHESVTFINTGNGLKDTDAYKKQMADILLIKNDINALKEYLNPLGRQS